MMSTFVIPPEFSSDDVYYEWPLSSMPFLSKLLIKHFASIEISSNSKSSKSKETAVILANVS